MKVINLGSLNIDRVYGVDHHVRAGETLASTSMEFFAGGKGLNQSIALAAAGVTVWHAGLVGGDGEMLTKYMLARGVDVHLVERVTNPTGHAVIQVDKAGQNCILLFGGANQCITETYIDAVLDQCGHEDILLLQNEISGLAYTLMGAAERGLQVALNPSPIDAGLLTLPLEDVTWFILNEIEGSALSGETEPERILDRLRHRYPRSQIVLTLGGDGVILDDGRSRHRHGAYRVDAVDTTAAGDTFTGYFLAGVSQGLMPEENLRTASLASALAITRKGAATSIPDRAEVLEKSRQTN